MILDRQEWVDLAPQGGSLKKSVDFVVPYAMGEKTHKEWVNSKVDLDRRRAGAGLEKYQPGRLFDPKYALRVIEEASFFAPPSDEGRLSFARQRREALPDLANSRQRRRPPRRQGRVATVTPDGC